MVDLSLVYKNTHHTLSNSSDAYCFENIASHLRNVSSLFSNIHQIAWGVISYLLIQHVLLERFDYLSTFICPHVTDIHQGDVSTYRRPLHAVQTKLPIVTLKYIRRLFYRVEKTIEPTRRKLVLLNYNRNIVCSLVMKPIHESFGYIFLPDVYSSTMFLPLFV